MHEAISKIPVGWPEHMIPADYGTPRAPYKGDRPFPRTILTRQKSPGPGHPNGERDLSIRELASLQGFPLKHKFAASVSEGGVRKQIGNAFPPSIAGILFKSIKDQLLLQDDLEESENLKQRDDTQPLKMTL